MAKELEQQSLRDYGIRKKQLRRRRIIFVFVLLLIIVTIGVVYFMKLQNRTYQGFQIENRVANEGSNSVSYLSYGSAIVRYSRDGATAFNKEGNLLWNGSYEMKDPIAATCGKYVVIADRGDKAIYIFNEKGVVNNFTTLHDITKVEVAKQGVVAALMEDEETSYIEMFSEDGELLTGQSSTYINKDGYPIDIALSEDGTKLVVSYFSITTGVLQSKVAVYNFGEVGQSENNRLVGGFDYEEVLIPRVSFLNNDTACAYKENGFVLYSIREKPSVIHEEVFDQKVQSIFHNEKYTGVILDKEDGSNQYGLLLYDLKGKKILDKKIDFDYDKVMISGDDIILHNNLACLILNTKGRKKFEQTFVSNVAAFFPINNVDLYFLVDASEICEIKLVEQEAK